MHGPEVPVAHVAQPLPPAAQPKLKFGVGGGVAWHIALQFACVCVPLVSAAHLPVVCEQLYVVWLHAPAHALLLCVLEVSALQVPVSPSHL